MGKSYSQNVLQLIYNQWINEHGIYSDSVFQLLNSANTSFKINTSNEIDTSYIDRICIGVYDYSIEAFMDIFVLNSNAKERRKHTIESVDKVIEDSVSKCYISNQIQNNSITIMALFNPVSKKDENKLYSAIYEGMRSTCSVCFPLVKKDENITDGCSIDVLVKAILSYINHLK